MSEKLWDGRFSENTSSSVEAFTASIQVDKRLYAYDIAGSVAHCKMLAKCGVISDEEAAELLRGLGDIKREIESGELAYDDSLEDIHMHIEARLFQKIGKVAQKLHTARSRNDQVALDVRMYLRKETADIIGGLARLRHQFIQLAQAHTATILPGYTHMQRAQPVLLAHHLLAYYEMFTRDARRLADCLGRINVMPLGTAALAGTTYPIDRHYVAALLDFPAVSTNSMDAVADRDFIMEFLAGASICMLHFSRLSEELILWSTSEFGYIELSDAFSTGSSIMPQKKNPDIPELVRGKTGRVIGDLVNLLTTVKSLPMAYNRDLQEDKEPLFDAVDTLAACVDIVTRMLPEITVRQDRMRQAASTGFLNATDLADYLVNQGVPFREAHSCVGRAVAYAIEKDRELHDLTLEELKQFSSRIEAPVFDLLQPESVVNRRTSFGGTAQVNVTAAIAAAREELDADMQTLPAF
jgi:argininosuccinate lyase